MHPNYFVPHQWWNNSALNAGRQEVPGSIPGHACRPSRLEFSVVFPETHVNTSWDPLERPSMEDNPTTGPGLTSGQLALTLQQINQPNCFVWPI